MGMRFYDPYTGVFTQQDPVQQPGEPRQANRYLYAAGDPITFVDPRGLLVNELLFATKGCVEGAISFKAEGPFLIKVGKRVVKVLPAGRAAGCIEGAARSLSGIL
jgi:hypothetical protein